MKELGNFIELETPVRLNNISPVQQEHHKILSIFNPSKEDFVNHSYSDLILKVKDLGIKNIIVKIQCPVIIVMGHWITF